ncbi:MAG: ketoacyl-ACP synthase III [Chloroflexi bacterium]|nr:ketoacyl-ACP synthase III [Chloroflexota bacterium]
MAAPEKVLTNHEIARMVDTNDAWIVERTGIRERRIAGPRDTTASLARRAAEQALDVAGVTPREVDLIIVATSTPQHFFPSTASLVQDALGAANAGAFDLAAACSGFMYGLSIGAQMIRSGAMRTVLVIGAETLSRILNWNDRGTCILFGDGAGAFVLQGKEQPGGVLSSLLRSDGSGGNLLMVPAGGSALPTSADTVRDNLHTITMNGREVYRFATRVMVSAAREVMANAGWTVDDLALIVPHQANLRIIKAAARGLGLPEDRFVINLDRYGNTSTASIPIAVCEAVAEGRIRPGDNLVLVGFGAGLTWGAVALNWATVAPPEVNRWQQLRRQSLYGLARLRSAARRSWRHVEGALWGAQEPEAQHPPYPPREEEKT